MHEESKNMTMNMVDTIHKHILQPQLHHRPNLLHRQLQAPIPNNKYYPPRPSRLRLRLCNCGSKGRGDRVPNTAKVYLRDVLHTWGKVCVREAELCGS